MCWQSGCSYLFPQGAIRASIPIVIVIVIMSHLTSWGRFGSTKKAGFLCSRFVKRCATFFSKSGTLKFCLCRYNCIRRVSALTSITLRAFVMPSLCLRFQRRKQKECRNKAVSFHQLNSPTDNRDKGNKSVWQKWLRMQAGLYLSNFSSLIVRLLLIWNCNGREVKMKWLWPSWCAPRYVPSMVDYE